MILKVWLKFQSYLDYPTFLNVRQTCHHFRNLVDSYLGHTVTFNTSTNRQEAFKFFTTVSLNDVQFEDSSDPGKYAFSKIFQDPGCLTDISFTETTNLPLIQDIITKCHGIQMLELTMTCKIADTRAPSENADLHLNRIEDKKSKYLLPDIDIFSPVPPKTCHLRYVECLKLVPGIHSDKNLRSHLVLSILRATCSGNHLKKVIFQCELDEEITLSRVLRVTAEVMERHPKLDALFLALLNDEYLLPEGEAKEFAHYMDLEGGGENGGWSQEVIHFRNRIVSTGEYLKITKMGIAMLNPSMQLIWSDFLKTQHHLVHLSLTVNIREGTFSKELFDSFSGTLEQMAIRGKFEVPFDFQYVSSCHNLKEICLHNLQENGGGGITPKCVNLPQVPDGLEGLILFQVVTRTEEIQAAIRKLDKLSTLVVFKCGHAAGETGVGLACLQDILHKRSLNSTLLVQFICGSTTEAETLAGVLYEMSQDTENQASALNRLRRRLRQQDPHQVLQEVPAGEPENILHLHDVHADDGEEVLFAIQGEGQLAPVLQEQVRPVSRGFHRNPGDEAPQLLDEQNRNGPLISGMIFQQENVEEFPQLPQPLQPQPPPPPFVEDEDENDNNPLNVLHNILEHVLVENRNEMDDEGIGEMNHHHHHQNHHLENNNLNFDNVHFNEMDDDVELIFDVGEQDINGPMLDLFAAERLAREHNVQVGFILDGVIDIINEEVVRSKWLCMEDSNGQITYTLKISVEL